MKYTQWRSKGEGGGSKKKVVKKILGYDAKISRGGAFKDPPGRQTP